MAQGRVLKIGSEEIILPGWLPRQAVDPKAQTLFGDDYWEMIASGSISLAPDQINEALQLAEEVEKLRIVSR